MKCHEQNEHWTLELELEEMLYLAHVFEEMIYHYGAEMGTLPDSVQTFWRGTLSRKPEKNENAEEAQEFLSEARQELRNERLALVQGWRNDLVDQDRAPWKLTLDRGTRDEFVSILNDRRLILALENDLIDEEFHLEDLQEFPEKKRAAAFEIAMLANVIAETLNF